MSGPILVVNPNSNPAVTKGLSEAVAPLRRSDGPAIECLTLAEGPFGIESARDAAEVVPPLLRLVEGRPDAAVVIVACFSDPGLAACRTVACCPVLGIMEAGVMTALARGDRFGVIAVAEGSIPRHRVAFRAMGVLGRLAAERAAGLSVVESACSTAFDRLREVGEAVRADGADTVILGCAGMARHRAPLEAALNRPVIEPTVAAVAMALGAVLAS